MQTNHSKLGPLIAGALLIGFGFLSLVGRVFDNLNWGFLSSLAIAGFGGLFFVVMFATGKNNAALAIPGTIVGGIGLVLLIQNVIHHWESMSYFWTLIIVFVGLGIYLMGWYGKEENQKQSGLRVMKVGFILFLIFGTFFEMIFSSFSSIVFPVMLILLGGYLVLARSGLFKRQADSIHDPMPPTT
jgi:hypothetical protein